MGEPIEYNNGKFSLSDHFTTSERFKDAVDLVQGKRSRLRDLASYLYFMRSPKSVYKNLSDADKLKFMMADTRFFDTEWVLEAVTDERLTDLLAYYTDLVMTPTERLRIGMIERIECYLAEMANATGEDIVRRVKEGDELFNALEKLENMVAKESSQKIRGGYKLRMFEQRPTTRA